MKGMVILLLLVLLPIVAAKEVNIPELFELSYEDIEIESSKEVYFYAGANLIASSDGNLEYRYQDRLESDIRSKILPFGQEIFNEERFSFTGKEFDSQLYYFNARYYDSEIGRFISVDPVSSEPAYPYVHNNPMNLIDPTGTIVTFPDTGDATQNFIVGLNKLFNTQEPLFGLNGNYLTISKEKINFENSEQEKLHGLLYFLADSNKEVFVEYIEEIGHASDNTIYFNPSDTFVRSMGEGGRDISLNPQIVFAHEAIHTLGYGEADAMKYGNYVRKVYEGMGEEYAELAPQRVYYAGRLDPTGSSARIWLYTPETYDKKYKKYVFDTAIQSAIDADAFNPEFGDIFEFPLGN
jgi:RHS repeat-associated protein